jgi:hypothetical protein
LVQEEPSKSHVSLRTLVVLLQERPMLPDFPFPPNNNNLLAAGM